MNIIIYCILIICIGPPLFHGDNWNSVILPKLKQFAKGIYEMRSDDAIRYAYLLGNNVDKKTLLYRLIPYLKDVNIVI